jgi:hypothetical protein
VGRSAPRDVEIGKRCQNRLTLSVQATQAFKSQLALMRPPPCVDSHHHVPPAAGSKLIARSAHSPALAHPFRRPTGATVTVALNTSAHAFVSPRLAPAHTCPHSRQQSHSTPAMSPSRTGCRCVEAEQASPWLRFGPKDACNGCRNLPRPRTRLTMKRTQKPAKANRATLATF